jgi:hypothetical protein
MMKIIDRFRVVLIASSVIASSSLLPLAAAAERVPQDHAAWRLVWFAITPTPQGPLAFKTPEPTPFGSKADCAAFGERMTARMQDWVRGLVRAEWDHDVRVAFACDVDGVPS